MVLNGLTGPGKMMEDKEAIIGFRNVDVINNLDKSCFTHSFVEVASRENWKRQTGDRISQGLFVI